MSEPRSTRRHRNDKYEQWVETINKHEGGFDKFSKGYERYGFIVEKNGDITYREWAPNALTANLVGDFSQYPTAQSPHNVKTRSMNRTASRQLGSRRKPDEEERFWCV